MCGIAGLIHLVDIDAEAKATVSHMLKSMRRRGPDGEGVWSSQNIVLGHVRLSIIDLSEAAAQPMQEATTGVAIVFNGEIYNYLELRKELIAKGHVFFTKSDTEVFLRGFIEWNTSVFQRLIGMWACAIVDPRTHTLILSRDRFGIKPLYLSMSGKRLIFGSTVSSVATGIGRRPEVNRRAVRDYLVSRAVDAGEQTFFAGISRFPAASFSVIDLSKSGINVEYSKYWDLRGFSSRAAGPPPRFEDACSELRYRLAESIKIHTRSDVEVATCLSGGLDSSSIASLLAGSPEGRSIRKVFSAVFPNSQFDESRYSRLVAERYGLEYVCVEPDLTEFLADIHELVSAQEEPFGSTGVYVQWKVFQCAAEHGAKVMLDGQGADEYLAGYFSFLFPFAIERLLKFAPIDAVQALIAYLRGGRFNYYMLQNLASLLHRLYGIGGIRFKSMFSELISPDLKAPQVECGDGRGPRLNGDFHFDFKQILLRYLDNISLPSLLRYEDRNSMWFSVESRVPFLDHRLVEFSLGLPTEYLIGGGTTKRVLREAVRGIVPQQIIDRKDKLGFANPERDWVGALVRSGRFSQLLSNSSASKFFIVPRVRKLIEERAESIDPSFLWRIYNVLAWDQYESR